MLSYFAIIIEIGLLKDIKMTRPLNWEEIQTFATVAEHKTTRASAKVLQVHHTTIIRRIEVLEADLGVRLFDRHPEGYVLTLAGEKLVTIAHQFSQDVTDVTRQISGQDNELSGTVRVTMPEPLAVEAFAPRLNEFLEQYPDLEIEFLTSFTYLNVAKREADVAIRMDNNPPETLIGKRLFPYAQTVYATQKYLGEHDFKNAPEKARWLRWDDSEKRFPSWTRDTEFGDVPTWGYFPDLNMQHAAAANGLGLAMLPCLFGDADPRLVRATNRDPIPSRDIWILTHSDLRYTARIRAFMQFSEKVLRDPH